MTHRANSATWDRLATETFDLLVIGGGITGAGVARDAALRGLKVALVEKTDFGSGTSSKSSKLIHGGLRYLQHAKIGLVFESVSERTRLLRLAPHLVRPLLFMAPAYKGQYPGLFMLDCGLWLYDALSKFASPARHQAYRKQRLLDLEPQLRQQRLTGGIVYFDSMTDDARLTLENILDAQASGAAVTSYALVTGFVKEADGRIAGVTLRDVLDEGRTVTVQARVTVNATGPWSDRVRGLDQADGEHEGPLLRPTKGVHIVVDAARLPVRHAVVMMSPRDGRVLFAIPWTPISGSDDGAGGRTVVGTTDTFYEGDLDHVAADRNDVDYLLDAANHYFPQVQLGEKDVISTWAGLRPLVAPPSQKVRASAVSREHRLIERPGLVTIIGGKLTTYRRMAALVVDAALPQLGKQPADLPCPTAEAPLPGARDLPEGGLAAVQAELAQRPGVDERMARHLVTTYGTRALKLAEMLLGGDGAQRLDPELPYVIGEVDVAVAHEAALRLDDVLARRVPLLLRARDQGLGCAQQVAQRMGRLLGWSAEQTAREVEHYRQAVALSREFRGQG